MTREHPRFGHDTRIGPSPQQREEEQEKILLGKIDPTFKYLNNRHEAETALKEKYGEDLFDFGRAYFGTGIGFGNWVVVRGQRIPKDEVRPKFTHALVEVIENQPSELKGEWLNIFLKEITDFSRG